jgi:hypothetical protein
LRKVKIKKEMKKSRIEYISKKNEENSEWTKKMVETIVYDS